MSRSSATFLVLCAFALASRLWHLEFQSLWWDEGVSIFLAGQSVRDLTVAKDFGIDLHPPGYHLLLAGWTALAGPSVFASRLLSVFAGVLTVPLAARFTRGIGRHWEQRSQGSSNDALSLSGAALVAGVLATVSPIDIFYSQEARMYPWLPAIGAASLIATVGVVQSNRWLRWLAWVAINVVGMYVFYYLAFLSASEALVLLALALRSERSELGVWKLWQWAIAQSALLVAYSPWIFILSRRLAGASLALPPETEVHVTSFRFLLDNWRAFTVGFTLPPGTTVLLTLWAVLAVIGAVVVCRAAPSAGALVLGGAFVPIAAAGAILLARPFYYPRFVLFVLIPLWALVAIGATASARFRVVTMTVITLIVVGNGWSWLAERTTPRVGYAPDNYRTVFATLADRIQPGDLVLGGYPWQAGYARAYLWRFDPRVRYIRPPVVPTQIGDVVASSGRAWTITYSPTQKFDPDPLETVLAKRYPTAVVDQLGDTRVRLFANPRSPAGSAMIGILDSKIGLQEPIQLAAAVTPGDALPVVLRWDGIADVGGNYTVFVHLVGPDGKLWGQVDSPPIHGFFPTRDWASGVEVVDRYSLAVNPRAPPGRYDVEVGMYDPISGDRLTVTRTKLSSPDNQIVVGTISVVDR